MQLISTKLFTLGKQNLHTPLIIKRLPLQIPRATTATSDNIIQSHGLRSLYFKSFCDKSDHGVLYLLSNFSPSNQKMATNSIMMFRLLYRSILLTGALSAAFAASASTRSDKGEIARNLDIFNSLYKELQTQYVDTIDASKSITTAINAMLNDIDPYTEYYSADDQDDIRTISTGEYGGIGSYIMQRNDGVYISEPYKGSPAQLAGLRAGDRIIMIDNDSVTSLPQANVSERLKGQAGTTLTVTVDRPHVEDSILTFELTRHKIKMP